MLNTKPLFLKFYIDWPTHRLKKGLSTQIMISNIIEVKVVTGAKKNEVKKENQGLKVYLTAPPVEGKANKLLIEILAKYFNCRKSNLKIIRGEKSRNKHIQIGI